VNTTFYADLFPGDMLLVIANRNFLGDSSIRAISKDDIVHVISRIDCFTSFALDFQLSRFTFLTKDGMVSTRFYLYDSFLTDFKKI
jgi:hypothetical protein